MFRATLFLIFAALAFAQSPGPLTQAFQGAYNNAKLNLTEAAELMPESEYGFKLSPAQRAFGEWIEHTAAGNLSFCAGIRGGPAPDAHGSHGGMKKAELVKALKESFDYCDSALRDMDDRKALAEIAMGDRKVYPVTSMIRLLVLLNGHYGNLVGYLRAKGITPPSTARAERAKNKKK